MAEAKTTGLILRTRLLTETSLIIHWLTPDLGRIATVAKGARRPTSNYRGKLDLFYSADFSFTRSARSDLHNLREVVLKETYSALREDIIKLQQASYATAFIEQSTEIEAPVPEIYQLMMAFLRHVVTTPPDVITVFAFEFKLLEFLGLGPEIGSLKVSPGTRQIVLRLAEDDFSLLTRLKPSGPQADEIQRFLHGFLIYHLGKLPRGRAQALEV